MLALIIIGILVAIIALIMIIPIGADIGYEDGELRVSAKAAGKLRTEGKTYVMQDGDVVEFKFNV